MLTIFTGKAGLALAAALGTATVVTAGAVIKNEDGVPLLRALLMPQAEEPQLAMPAVPAIGGSGEQAGENAAAEEVEVAALPGADIPAAVSEPDPPAFDILRVERDGSVVVAGRTPANSRVEILVDGRVAATGAAGPDGDFAIVFDEPLPSGDHELVIRATAPDADPVLSVESGIVSVPEPGDADAEVLAMVSKEGTASRILQGPGSGEQVAALSAEPETPPAPEPAVSDEQPQETAAVTPETEPVKPVPAPVLVNAVDVEPDRVFIAGTGEPGAKIQVYIDNRFRGAVIVSPQGAFLLELDETLAAGKHDLRADMVDAGTGGVAARAEVVIDHQPEPVVAEVPAEETPVAEPVTEPVAEAEGSTPEEAVAAVVAPEAGPVESTPEQAQPVPVIRTGRSVIIRRGDNLWRISRRMLGEGRKYTLIFEANTEQIRNPDLIFPGQVFEVPDEEPS